MYRVDRNNFYDNEKNATVCTPDYVSRFLYDILSDCISARDGVVLDPCVGSGSLLKPWKESGYDVVGIDIEHQGFPHTIVKNYLALERHELPDKIALVLMNPPFNIDAKTKSYIREHYGGRPLLPEVWFSKAIELLGTGTPVAMFTPYGFRLNQTEHSKRWQKFVNEEYPAISGIVSLPKDVFTGILFHSEVLIFNIPLERGHYFVTQRRHDRKGLRTAA